MKIIFITFITIILLAAAAKSSFAFDRNAFLGSRITVNSNYTRNVNTVVLNSGPVSVGSTNHSLPAYQSVAQTITQIQALKEKLKNFSPK